MVRKAPSTEASKPTVVVRTASATSARLPQAVETRTSRTVNGYHFDLDETRRTRFVDATLKLTPAKRSRKAQHRAGKPDRRTTDDGGHYIAARLNGPHDEFNHFAQDANFNRGAYRALEENWAEAIKRGQKVRVTIRPIYTDASRRPDTLHVRYEIDGFVRLRRFANLREGR